MSLLVASLCKADTYEFYKKNSLFILPQSWPLAYKSDDPNWNHWCWKGKFLILMHEYFPETLLNVVCAL